MSQLTKHSERRVLWTVGNTRIVDDEPDTGIVPLVKVAMLGIGAISVASVSPVIAIALAGYASLKIFDLATAIGKDGADIAGNIYDDVNGAESVPDGWVPIPQLPESVPAQIGNATRLGAIDVQSQSVQTATTQRTIALTGLSSIVSDPYQSRAFFGAQRTGKSYLAAVASREISNALNCKIFHLNLASFGTEDSVYWKHATETLRGDLSSLDAYEAKDLIKDAIALIKRFYSQQNAILIVDEIAYIGSISNQHAKLLEPLLTLIADKITTLSSSGKKRQQAIWTIAPEFVAGALTQDAKAVKKLKLCYVAAHPNKSLDWNGQAISFDWELFRQIKANFEISEPSVVPNSDRVCFIAPNWMSVGELPKLGKSESVRVAQASPIKAESDDADTTYPISEIAAMLGIDRPVIEADEPVSVASQSRPEALDNYPMVKAVCLYLEGKEPRSLTQIANTMRNCKKITDEDLQQRLGTGYTNYKEGVQQALFFGVREGFITQVSQDAFTVNY